MSTVRLDPVQPIKARVDASVAILVGGQGRRLGLVSKPRLTVGEDEIVATQVDAITAAGFGAPQFVGRGRAGDWPGPLVPDAVAGTGALGGLYTALLVATTPVVVVLAGDMPFVSPALLDHLAMVGDADAVVPRTGDGWHPLCAGYRRGVAGRLKTRLDRGALRVADALMELRVNAVDLDQLTELDPTHMLLANVNTPADLELARRHARRRR